MMKQYAAFSFIFFLLITSRRSSAQAAEFSFTYTGTSAEVENAIQSAADIWSQYLVSDIPVKVAVHFQLLTPGLLGITFPNGIKDFAGAPLGSVWYPTSLANAIDGTELNAGFADMEIYLNSSAAWYYGTDGIVPAGKYDLVTIALHEMGHGLGIISLADKISSEGSFGLITSDMFAPLSTSFPWPDLDTLPSIFDTYLEDPDGNKLISYINPSLDLGTIFTSNNVWYNSPSAVIANDGEKIKIYAPGVYALGSSITHLDEATYPAGTENELMTPNGTPGAANHKPGGIVTGILKDIGWTVTEPVPVYDKNDQNDIFIYPNPASDILHIHFVPEQQAEVEIYDVNGQKILSAHKTTDNYICNISDLHPGIYFIKFHTENIIFNRTFIKL